jgi:hypothetical protein
MRLREFGFEINSNKCVKQPVPECVLNVELNLHVKAESFKKCILAYTFYSGPADADPNSDAMSYVFYFFKDAIAPRDQKPSDLITFKVRSNAKDKIHRADRYLGGMSVDVQMAPTLDECLSGNGMDCPDAVTGLLNRPTQVSKEKIAPKQESGCLTLIAVTLLVIVAFFVLIH